MISFVSLRVRRDIGYASKMALPAPTALISGGANRMLYKIAAMKREVPTTPCQAEVSSVKREAKYTIPAKRRPNPSHGEYPGPKAADGKDPSAFSSGAGWK